MTDKQLWMKRINTSRVRLAKKAGLGMSTINLWFSNKKIHANTENRIVLAMNSLEDELKAKRSKLADKLLK